MKLGDYLVEVRKADAASMELSIVQAFNGNKRITPKANEEIARAVSRALHGMGVKGKAHHFGKKGAALSKDWLDVGGAKNKTAKTDLFIGGRKISLKKDGKSQLMSAGREEAKGVFGMALASYLSHEKLDEIQNEVLSTFDDMSGFIKAQNTATTIKAGTAKDEDPKVIKNIMAHEDVLHARVSKKIESLFSDESFKKHVIFEAATGAGKFGGNEGTATELLVFNDHGLKYFKSLRRVTSPHIAAMAQNVTVGVRWKSARFSGIRNIYSTVRLEIKEELENYSSTDLMNEGVLTGLIDKIRNFFVSAWNKVKSKVFSNVTEFLKFFGIEFQNMTVNVIF